jgi:hypothetical protein
LSTSSAVVVIGEAYRLVSIVETQTLGANPGAFGRCAKRLSPGRRHSAFQAAPRPCSPWTSGAASSDSVTTRRRPTPGPLGATGRPRKCHSRGHGFDARQLHQLQQQLARVSEDARPAPGLFRVYFSGLARAETREVAEPP